MANKRHMQQAGDRIIALQWAAVSVGGKECKTVQRRGIDKIKRERKGLCFTVVQLFSAVI